MAEPPARTVPVVRAWTVTLDDGRPKPNIGFIALARARSKTCNPGSFEAPIVVARDPIDGVGWRAARAMDRGVAARGFGQLRVISGPWSVPPVTQLGRVGPHELLELDAGVIRLGE